MQMTEESQEIEAMGFDQVLDKVEESANQGPDISEMAFRVLTAARMDAAQGDETYSPERAAEAQPHFDEEELEDACEELVDTGLFVRTEGVYQLEAIEDE